MEIRSFIHKTRRATTLFFGRIPRLALALISLTITLQVFLNSAESIFNMDIPFVGAIRHSTLTNTINYSINQTESRTYTYTLNSFISEKKMMMVEIPVLNRKLELSKALNKDNEWYAKGNKANYLVTQQNDKSENLIVYMESSWRTITDISPLKVGDLIYMATDDEMIYVFRIDAIQRLNSAEKFVPPTAETVGMTFLISDEESTGYSYIHALLISSKAR